MIRISMLVVAIFATNFVYSQISLGPRVGLSSSKVKVEERLMYSGEEISYNTHQAKMGFHLGAFARINLAGLYVQPEILYTSSGGTIEVSSGSLGNEIQTYRFNKIDLPVMAGVKVLKFIRIQAGPVFSMMLNNRVEGASIFNQFNQEFSQASIGYQAGFGLDVGKIYLDLKYEGNLSKLGNEVTIGNQEFNTDIRNNLIILAVGIDLL